MEHWADTDELTNINELFTHYFSIPLFQLSARQNWNILKGGDHGKVF